MELQKTNLNPFVLLQRIVEIDPHRNAGQKSQSKDKTKNSRNKLKCYFCAKVLVNLNLHLRIHTQEEHFKCSVCRNRYRRSSQLEHHFSIVHKKQKFECEICFSKFASKTHYKRHLSNHDVKTKKTCPKCPKSFKTARNLKRHFEDAHSGNILHCGLCDKTFPSKLKLKYPIETTHEQKRKHECAFCPKTFYARQELTLHTNKIHLGQKDFTKCPEPGCLLIFENRSAAHYHRLRCHRHSGANEVKQGGKRMCNVCHKFYSSASSLRDHFSRIHEKVVNFHCSFCGKGFYKRSELDGHITSVHTAERAFQCDRIDCGKTFSAQGTLWNHIQNHLDKELGTKYFCTECPNRVFGTKQYLVCHKSKYHKF